MREEHDKEKEALRKQVQELMSDNDKILKQQRCLEKENGALIYQLDNINEEKVRMAFELNKATSENEEVYKIRTDLESKVWLLSTAVKQLNEGLISSEVMVEALSVRSELAESLANKMSKAEDAALTQVQICDSEMVDVRSELDLSIANRKEIRQDKDKLEEDIAEVRSELEESKAEKEKFLDAKNNLEEQMKLVSLTIAQLNGDLLKSGYMVQKLSATNEIVESLANKMSEAKDYTLTKLQIFATMIK